MSDIRDPLWEKVKGFEEQQRQARRVVVRQWMDEIIHSVGLREEFARMIDVADAWTNKTAVKSKVKAEIEAKTTAPDGDAIRCRSGRRTEAPEKRNGFIR